MNLTAGDALVSRALEHAEIKRRISLGEIASGASWACQIPGPQLALWGGAALCGIHARVPCAFVSQYVIEKTKVAIGDVNCMREDAPFPHVSQFTVRLLLLQSSRQ